MKPHIKAELDRLTAEVAARPKISPAEAAFHSACLFHEGSNACMENGGGGGPRAVLPGIVNLAFAAEIYLKSLLLDSGNAKKGHHLHDLFKSLDISTRNLIDQNYQPLPHVDNRGLNIELKEFSRAFETWRYNFEVGDGMLHINFGALSAFSVALYRTLRSSNPEWQHDDNRDRNLGLL